MRRNYKQLFFFFVLVFLVCFSNCTFLEKPYDLVIKNGFIIDGTGNPWFKSDIGLKKQKIVRIGFIDENQAKKSIDAQNLIVSPGFIDIHTHCDRKIAEVPTVDNYIYQGVTTVIGGNCGGHPFPLKESRRSGIFNRSFLSSWNLFQDRRNSPACLCCFPLWRNLCYPS
jgi:hypothetical protein